MIKDRLREAETRSALNAMLRDSLDAGRERPWLAQLQLWWQAPAAWVAHLALPKIWNRL